MLDLLLPAMLGGLGIALAVGPLGSFIVWRKMAFFGDTLAHAALTGVALALIMEIPTGFGITFICSLIALGLLYLTRLNYFSTDTLLGILSHSALAIGIIILSLSNIKVNMMSFLFGDILSIGFKDLYWIFGCSLLTIIVLSIFWKKLLAVTLYEELAKVEGINTKMVDLIFVGLIALVTAVGIKMMGVLLITALLVIPAAAARPVSKTPGEMVLFSSLIACIAVLIGLSGSVLIDIPVGPAIVASTTVLFILTQTSGKLLRTRI